MVNSPEDLEKEWYVVPCPCDYSDCQSSLIEPNIIGLQGSISYENAIHIVGLHNTWLLDRKTSNLRLTYDLDRLEFRLDGVIIRVTPIQRRLLTCFIKNVGVTLDRVYLLNYVWGISDPLDVDPTLVRMHIKLLRKKLGVDESGPIVTIRGRGYRYDGF